MVYLISFLEGIVTFVSPCVLPLLPIYLAYFAGGRKELGNAPVRTAVNALGFVLGFTAVFVAMGVFSGAVGGFLAKYQMALNLACGAIVVLFGLNYMGVLKVGALNKVSKPNAKVRPMGFASALLFGMVFAVGWTPCVGAFLGSALLLAAQQGSMLTGALMLVCYSLGLGVPFVLSAVLVGQLEDAFAVVKKHRRTVDVVCGLLLVVMGVAMATGLMGRLLSLLGA